MFGDVWEPSGTIPPVPFLRSRKMAATFINISSLTSSSGFLKWELLHFCAFMGVRLAFLITLAVSAHRSSARGAERHWQKIFPVHLCEGALLTQTHRESLHDVPVHKDKKQFVTNGRLKSRNKRKVVSTTALTCAQCSQGRAWV